MKIVFLASSSTIIYYMRFHATIKFTYDKQQDTFRILFVLIPAAVLALLIHQDWSIVEVRALPYPYGLITLLTEFIKTVLGRDAWPRGLIQHRCTGLTSIMSCELACHLICSHSRHVSVMLSHFPMLEKLP